jgi:hypothetical protein
LVSSVRVLVYQGQNTGNNRENQQKQSKRRIQDKVNDSHDRSNNMGLSEDVREEHKEQSVDGVDDSNRYVESISSLIHEWSDVTYSDAMEKFNGKHNNRLDLSMRL